MESNESKFSNRLRQASRLAHEHNAGTPMANEHGSSIRTHSIRDQSVRSRGNSRFNGPSPTLQDLIITEKLGANGPQRGQTTMKHEARGGPVGEQIHQQVRAPTTESSQYRKALLIRELLPSNAKGFAPLLGGKHESEMKARGHTTVQARDCPELPLSINVVGALSGTGKVLSLNCETSR